MECPVCRSVLIKDGEDYLETLCEHVECVEPSLKTRYICSNESCSTRGKAGICWNEGGEVYSQDFRASENCLFIENNNAPFGSFQRKLNVEIGNKGENSELRVGPVTIVLKYHYKANEQGEILSRRPTFDIIIKGTYYHSGISMLIYCLKKFYMKRKYFVKEKSLLFRKDLLDDFGDAWGDKRWWKRLFRWYVNTFHKKLKKMLMAQKGSTTYKDMSIREFI